MRSLAGHRSPAKVTLARRQLANSERSVGTRSFVEERIAAHFASLATGPGEVYPLDNLLALKIVLNGARQGGAGRSLRMDTLGKNVAAALLRMEIEAPAHLPRLARP